MRDPLRLAADRLRDRLAPERVDCAIDALLGLLQKARALGLVSGTGSGCVGAASWTWLLVLFRGLGWPWGMREGRAASAARPSFSPGGYARLAPRRQPRWMLADMQARSSSPWALAMP